MAAVANRAVSVREWMMAKRLAVLHTSFVFINVETMMNDLFRELLPEVDIVHFVDSSLLAHVMESGGVTPQATRRLCFLAEAADEAGADLILSACSSVGPAVDIARYLVDRPIIKIDDAMTQTAVELGQRIGVLATVNTTLGPTVQLIHEKAASMAKHIDVRPKLADGAFEALMGGQRDQHDRAVLAAAEEVAEDSDVIVLAQASMTRLAPSLSQATHRRVLSSPRLGIEYARQLLGQMPG
jgi:Asp/Glu/hydantoin racemase